MAGKAGASGGHNRAQGESPNKKPVKPMLRPSQSQNAYWKRWREGQTAEKIREKLLVYFRLNNAIVPDDIVRRLANALYNKNICQKLFEEWNPLEGSEMPEYGKKTVVEQLQKFDTDIGVCWKNIQTHYRVNEEVKEKVKETKVSKFKARRGAHLKVV